VKALACTCRFLNNSPRLCLTIGLSIPLVAAQALFGTYTGLLNVLNTCILHAGC
jgi:hypothetical protein